MTPQKGDEFISIPVTFDKQSKGRILTRSKFLWSALIFGCQFFIWVLFLLAGSTQAKILFPFLGLTCWLLITRFILLREKYFKAKRAELRKQDYMFGTSVFWNVNSIDEAYPYFVRFGSGLLGVFVIFDKDVIVGRPEDDDYYHYEAIADAYQEMCKRNISCMHIDYMDVCGRDDRMKELFHLAANAENEDLRLALTRFYDNIEDLMNRAYASYDVYCFYSQQREELFWEDVQGVINILNQANFVRSRILDKEEIGKLTKTLFNLEDFSVSQACDVIYKDQSTNFLKPIWTERDGKRTILNKTTEELNEAKRVAIEEKNLRRVKTKKEKLKKGEVPEDDRISLWGDPIPEIKQEVVTDPRVLKQQEKLKMIEEKKLKEAQKADKLRLKQEQEALKAEKKANKGKKKHTAKADEFSQQPAQPKNNVQIDYQAQQTAQDINQQAQPQMQAQVQQSVQNVAEPQRRVVRKPVVKKRNETVNNDEEDINLFD